jgi:hypothetical protein
MFVPDGGSLMYSSVQARTYDTAPFPERDTMGVGSQRSSTIAMDSDDDSTFWVEFDTIILAFSKKARRAS